MINLLRRLWAAWRLRKRKFVLCLDCATPLLPIEIRNERCVDCQPLYELKVKENRSQGSWAHLHGTWDQLMAPGLQQGVQQAQHRFQQGLAQQQMQQMQQLSLEQQRQQVQQMMNTRVDDLQQLLGFRAFTKNLKKPQ